MSLKNALKNKLASLRPEKGEKLCNCEKQQQTCEVLCQAVHYGSHLRVLSGVLCLSSNRLVSFKGSGSCHEAWVYSPLSGCRNPRTRLALSSVPGGTFCSEQCRPKTGRHRGPRQRKSRQGQTASIKPSDLSKKSSRRNAVKFVCEGVKQ